MGWEVKVYSPNRSTLLRTLTPEAPGGLDAGTEWQLDPHGGTANLQLFGRNDTLGIPPRAVVTLTVDGVPQFHGIVPDAPSLGSPDAETVLVAGGVEALRVTLMDGAVYRNQGVYQIARDILSRLCPPALVYDATQIGDGSGTDAGPVLDTFYSPTAPLAPDGSQKGVLQALAESAKVPWGVDAQGRVFLGRPAAAPLAVAYAGQPWRRLPSQGREAVTEAVLRVVSAPSVPDGGSARYAFVPATIATVATHATHSTLRAQRAVEPPAGVGLIAQSVPAGTSLSSDYDGTPVMDDSSATYVTVDLTNTQRGLGVYSAPGRIVGVEFDYALPSTQESPPDPFGWSMNFATLDGTAFGVLPVTTGIRTMRVILPPGAGLGALPGSWTADFRIGALLAVSPTPSTVLYVYRVRFLVIDEAAALRTAESYLQVPYASPAELTLPGLIPPSPTVSVTGSPDGDVTADAGLYVYKIAGNDGRQTLVRLGSTGQDQTVRALKWAVRS